MIKIENVETFGLVNAMRGMRNPMNSWDKMDSYYDMCHSKTEIIGAKDLDLLVRLTKAGTEHRKALRMMHIQLDITAPLYWWKDFDTYKVGTVANSCSTMHKIHVKEFVADDFSHEHMDMLAEDILAQTIMALNVYRARFIEDRRKHDWYNMIQLLPSSYNQRRTIDMNYETAITILKHRSDHKLNEFRTLCTELLEQVPYLKEIWEASRP